MFFVAMELSQQAKHIAKTGEIRSYQCISTRSHPSFVERQLFLRNELRRWVGTQAEFDKITLLADRYGDIARAAWDIVQRVLVKFAKDVRRS